MILIIAFACILILMGLQRIVYTKYWDDKLNVKISYKYVDCMADEENELVEVITNEKWLPLPMMHVKFDMPKSFVFENEKNSSISDNYYRDDVFSINGNQKIIRTLKFKCTSRGCFYMNDINLTSSDLFLKTILSTRRKNPAVIHVFPKKIALDFFEVPFNTITGNFSTNKTMIEDPFEFRGIRPYQQFDSMKHINWKSSAKNGELKVNTFFMTSSQDVKVLLNMDTHVYAYNERLIEKIVSIASSICEKVIEAGIPVGLISNGKDIYTHERIVRESGSGVKHMRVLDTALARIDAKAENYNFADVLKDEMISNTDGLSSRTYYIIISNNRSKELIGNYRETKKLGILSYFIIPEYTQYEITEQIPDMIKWDID